MGVCLQEDILWPDLSVGSHLRLFSLLRGVPLGMLAYFVSAAAEVIGLDGDEFHKRQAPVLLTTHAMDEAEAVCTDLGILVKGRLCALDPPQALKSRFAPGYVLSITLRESKHGSCSGRPSHSSSVQDTIENHHDKALGLLRQAFPGLILRRSWDLGMEVSVPSVEASVQQIFEKMARSDIVCQVADWGISQETLEKAFLNVVVQAQGPVLDLDDDLIAGDSVSANVVPEGLHGDPWSQVDVETAP
eukprot:gene10433-279_t